MNKFQKSLDRIKKNVPLHEDSWTDEDREHILTVMEAVEKQIAKKPIKYDDCEQFFIECPCCQKRFDSRLGYKGCPYCLQTIRLE